MTSTELTIKKLESEINKLKDDINHVEHSFTMCMLIDAINEREDMIYDLREKLYNDNSK